MVGPFFSWTVFNMLQNHVGQLFHFLASLLSKTFTPLHYFTRLKIIFFDVFQNPRNHFLSTKASLGPNLHSGKHSVDMIWQRFQNRILYPIHFTIPSHHTNHFHHFLTEFVGWLCHQIVTIRHFESFPKWFERILSFPQMIRLGTLGEWLPSIIW